MVKKSDAWHSPEAKKKAIENRMAVKEEKKLLKDCLEEMLRRKIRNARTPEGEELTVRHRLCQAVIDKVLSCGDVKGFEVIRDTIGEKPTDKVEHSGTVVMPVVEVDGVELELNIGEEVVK